MAKKRKRRKLKYSDFMSKENALWMEKFDGLLDHGTHQQRQQAIAELTARLVESTRKSAESGDAESMMRLADWYAQGFYVDLDSTLAELWRQRALSAGAKPNPYPEETPPAGITPDTDSPSV